MYAQLNLPNPQPSFLEKFGIYYLNFFKRIDKDYNAFDFTDQQLKQK